MEEKEIICPICGKEAKQKYDWDREALDYYECEECGYYVCFNHIDVCDIIMNYGQQKLAEYLKNNKRYNTIFFIGNKREYDIYKKNYKNASAIHLTKEMVCPSDGCVRLN